MTISDSQPSMTVSASSAGESRRNRHARLTIVDTDVHHDVTSRADLYPYLSQTYRERFEEYGFGVGSTVAQSGGFQGRRVDTIRFDGKKPQSSGTAAVDIAETRSQLLDACGIDVAILTGGSILAASAMMDLDYASALCRAFNDFTVEHWLAADSRFRFTLAVCSQDPTAAAAEIDRLGSHPGVVGVVMACGAPRPFGQRFYHPIYEACERHQLTLALHFGGEGSGINPPPSAAGYPSYYIESRMSRPSYYIAHLSSFVFEGVFEKFPTLKVAMLEGGFGWVPQLLWRMDLDWKGLRSQTPWVQRLPSEYVLEHVRFSSQPLEEPADPKALEHIIAWMDGSHTLMFSSDYPHWDWDDPAMTFLGLDADVRKRIFADNAVEAFRLEIS